MNVTVWEYITIILAMFIILVSINTIIILIVRRRKKLQDPEVIDVLNKIISFVYRAAEDKEVDSDIIYSFNRNVVDWVTMAYMKSREADLNNAPSDKLATPKNIPKPKYEESKSKMLEELNAIAINEEVQEVDRKEEDNEEIEEEEEEQTKTKINK